MKPRRASRFLTLLFPILALACSFTPTGLSSVDQTIDFPVFLPGSPWNEDISSSPEHPSSAAFIASIGGDSPLHPDFGTVWEGAPNGIPFMVVAGSQRKVRIDFDNPEESDPGPYPVPRNAPIEGGPGSDGDRHVLVVDRTNLLLYELYYAFPNSDGSWSAGSGAVWDLKLANPSRPLGWTSADAAGLPIFPGLVRYDEVASGEIRHALRFTAQITRRAFIAPASHWASEDEDPARPPMGLRMRLRADFDISGFSDMNRTILAAMKRYGIILADNGGNWYVSGAPDPRWDDEDLAELSAVRGSDLEAVYSGDTVTSY